MLVGKDIILVVDADEAGIKGADKTAKILRAAGVRRIFTWLPPDGCKDARAAFNPSAPSNLAESIITNKNTKTQ